jgi:hypothetical protein
MAAVNLTQSQIAKLKNGHIPVEGFGEVGEVGEGMPSPAAAVVLESYRKRLSPAAFAWLVRGAGIVRGAPDEPGPGSLEEHEVDGGEDPPRTGFLRSSRFRRRSIWTRISSCLSTTAARHARCLITDDGDSAAARVPRGNLTIVIV